MKIRQAAVKDFDKINELNGYCYGFDSESSKERFFKRFEIIYDEQYCLEIDDKIVANARYIPFEQNIRGKAVTMVGIAMVVSDPITRRKGYVRDIMNYLLKKMSNEKIAVSTLYPFKDTFYSAFGYVNAPQIGRLIVNPKQLKKWNKLPEGYTIQRLPHAEGIKYYKEIHRKVMQNIHGGVYRSEKRWKEYEFPNPTWFAIVFNPKGEVEGAIRYHSKGFSTGFDWAEIGRINIVDFILTLTPKARQAILNYFYLHTDQVVEIKIPINPNESELYTWLQDYFKLDIASTNIWMGRVIDIPNTLQGLPVKAEGSIKIKITDGQINENNQTFEIISEKGKLLVNPIGNKKADIEMTIEGLTALVYGFLTANDLEVFNWIKNVNEKNIALLNSFFPLLKPVLTEEF